MIPAGVRGRPDQNAVQLPKIASAIPESAYSVILNSAHFTIELFTNISGDIILRLKNGSGWTFKINESKAKLEGSIFIAENNVLKSQQILVKVSLNSLISSKSKTIKWAFLNFPCIQKIQF